MNCIGTYDGTIFYNPANKFCIISVKTADQSVPAEARSNRRYKDHLIRFTAVGYEIPRTDAVELELDGEWAKGKYGVQLQVEQWREIVPRTKNGVEGYLASGLIKGIGPKTAADIVERFGVDTLDILEHQPERLLEIRGITENKLEDIKASYAENRMLQGIMTLLAPFKITPKTALKIYQYFGPTSVEILEKSPFELCQISGFGFRRVDAIVQKSGGDLHDPMRIKGAVFCALDEGKSKRGHLYISSEELEKSALKLLNEKIPVPELRLHQQEVRDMMQEMILNGAIVSVKDNIYLPRVFAQEDETARRIAQRLVTQMPVEHIAPVLEQVKVEMGLRLSAQQEAAVYAAFRHGLSVITGSPGTGKTTVLRTILEVYRRLHPDGKIALMAPTGRASRRMSESTGFEDARTLHSGLGLTSEEDEGKVAIRQNYIYYHYKKGGAKTGYCTYCEKEVPIKVHPHHNQQGRCICCRHPVVFKAYGRAGYMQTEKHFAYLIQRCKDGFVVREFQADRTYGKESLPNSKLYCQEIRRTIYDRERKPRTYYWGLYKQRNMRWISGSPCSYSWSGSHDGRVYGKTLPTLEQQELRCTGLVNWIRKQKSVDPEKYLAVLERIPQMEQISKVNLPKLTKECFSSCGTVSELIKNHSAGSLIKALGLDSRRFQRLRLHNGGCDLLRWLQYEKGIGREIPDNVLLWMCQQDIEPGDVQFIADRMSMVQVYNYVRRQMPSFRRNSHEVLRTWEDYLSMAKKLHMNVYDEIVYRTRKLRRRHDDLVLKCQEKDIELQAEEMEEKFPHVNAICQEIKAKYEYADADYMVVVPDGILDIITEGRALHHCAGSSDRYWDRIERRESFVVFLRKTADPFHAYYTLEVEPDGTVRQKRTEYDRQKKDIEQATEFLQKWQRVITARLTESDKALAAESRILREKEFIQLKKDRVIIHTGHLAGRLLADVLMADLMENTDSIQSPVLAAAA